MSNNSVRSGQFGSNVRGGYHHYNRAGQGIAQHAWRVGDNVLTSGVSDGSWRKGVIQEIDNSEATVIVQEDQMVRATRVNLANIRRPEDEKQSNNATEAFNHKEVEAWMEEHAAIFEETAAKNPTASGTAMATGILSRAALKLSPTADGARAAAGEERQVPWSLGENVVSSSTGEPPLEPCSGNLVTLSRTGRGSRYLQSLLSTTPSAIQQVQTELLADPVAAMTHPKACYVVQKLLDVVDPAGLSAIVNVVVQNFAALSLSPAGCHVVQKVLTVAPNRHVIVIQLENYRTLMGLLKSPHGTYVAQACLPLLPARTTTYIINTLLGHIVELGKNPHGTYFLQRLVSGQAGGGVSVDLVVEEVLGHVRELAHDQFGTWLVQATLKCGDLAVKRLAMWVRSNMLAVYKDQPSMFLALSVVEQLRERCRVGGASTVHWPSLLADLITVMTDTQVGGRPLLVVAALHPVGHLLAREVARQVTHLGQGIVRNRMIEVVSQYVMILAADSYGCLVLKGLHEASSCYNLKRQ